MDKVTITVEIPTHEEKEQFKKDFEQWMRGRPPTIVADLVDPNKWRITGGPPRERQAPLPLKPDSE